MSRFIVIGDIHGCHLELRDLLDKLQPATGDRIVQVGDLINRGPDSHEAIAVALQTGMKCILGNHERRLLQYRRTGDASILKDYDWDTVEVLDDGDWEFLESMPVFHEETDLETLVIHAGFVPNGKDSWRKQSPEILTGIDVVDPNGKAAKRGDAPGSPPWADLWAGPPFVVYGHIPRRDIYRRRWSLGIDTACIYGEKLTAVILPGFEIVQVRARRAYVPKTNLADPAAP